MPPMPPPHDDGVAPRHDSCHDDREPLPEPWLLLLRALEAPCCSQPVVVTAWTATCALGGHDARPECEWRLRPADAARTAVRPHAGGHDDLGPSPAHAWLLPPPPEHVMPPTPPPHDDDVAPRHDSCHDDREPLPEPWLLLLRALEAPCCSQPVVVTAWTATCALGGHDVRPGCEWRLHSAAAARTAVRPHADGHDDLGPSPAHAWLPPPPEHAMPPTPPPHDDGVAPRHGSCHAGHAEAPGLARRRRGPAARRRPHAAVAPQRLVHGLACPCVLPARAWQHRASAPSCDPPDAAQ